MITYITTNPYLGLLYLGIFAILIGICFYYAEEKR